ncbi:C-type lectin domain family 4 member F C-type lectin superfamily member 13 [Channa argus]|uniref:C-type lectin domain family 4 member F C-type lectin superfamily member 13 n=1 Tax=Channa argus TaxID=215402 RepID=A0A6G1QXW0_CHAAH|nr:C-type lectin domain family 4 member F C-type lectin superfamily member 13 [Channa argus]
MKNENETMIKTLQTLKTENEAMKKNLTEFLSEIKQCTRLQPMCPEPTEVNTNEPCQKCEEGWELHGGKCYYFSNKPSSWSQSREECVRRGGDLVKIDSREEQSFLEERLRNKMNEAEDKFWIGLTDSQEEGRWLWVDGSELDTSLKFWSGKEPDNWKGTNEVNPDGQDCVRMGEKGGAVDLKCWFDQSCNNPHKSICEKAAQTGRYVCNCSL